MKKEHTLFKNVSTWIIEAHHLVCQGSPLFHAGAVIPPLRQKDERVPQTKVDLVRLILRLLEEIEAVQIDHLCDIEMCRSAQLARR